VRLHLCRHADAAPGTPDELRTLTAEGVAAATELGRRLAASDPPPRVVLTSPLVRARETAERVGAELAVPVLVDTRLAPGATPAGLLAALELLEGPVVAVGHQPDCSQLVEALTGTAALFPPAGCVELEVDPGSAPA
jgi:phosphohistidine phosphatase SixA